MKNRVNDPYLPDLLRPKEVQTILRALGLKWHDHKVNNLGWVRINSPLRDDRKPSFSLSIIHGGFKDFGTDETGNIIQLVRHIKGYNSKNAKKWILKTANIKLTIY